MAFFMRTGRKEKEEEEEDGEAALCPSPHRALCSVLRGLKKTDSHTHLPVSSSDSPRPLPIVLQHRRWRRNLLHLLLDSPHATRTCCVRIFFFLSKSQSEEDDEKSIFTILFLSARQKAHDVLLSSCHPPTNTHHPARSFCPLSDAVCVKKLFKHAATPCRPRKLCGATISFAKECNSSTCFFVF